MFITQVEGRCARPPEQENATREAVIAEGALHRLGEPDALHTVQVKPVFGSNYRVNVYVRAGTSYRVAHSYFVEADGDGRILASSPAITRVY